MKLRISPLLIAIPAILALSACQSSTEKVGGIPRTTKPITEYVSLSPSTTEILNAVGTPMSGLLGRTSSCNYPAGAVKVPIVVNGTTPDFEKIAAIKPERVIVEKDLYPESTIQKLKDLGLEVLVVETDTPKAYDEFLTKLAVELGSESSTSFYLDKVYGAKSLLKGSITSDMKIAVVIGDATTGYMMLGTNALLANYIKESEGEFVGPDARKFEAVSVEQLIKFGPNIIITQLGSGTKMLQNPQMKAVPAIAQGHVLEVEPDILLRNGGRIDVLLEGVATGIGRVERKGE